MKILQINAFHYLRGGVERSYFETAELLKDHGHEVVVFSMKNEKNKPSSFEKYFVSYLDVEKPKLTTQTVLKTLRIFWSQEAQSKIGRLIQEERPNIAHLHCPSRHITPSVIPVLKKYQIPIVYHLHDFKPLCPQRNFYSQDKICEKCQGNKFYSPFFESCIKESRLVSLLGSMESYLHYFKKVYQQVDCFIAPSRFIYQKYIEFGYPEEKINYLPHFLPLNQLQPQFNWDEEKNYCLYFGRLSKEKGILTLIKAVSQVPDLNLYLVGTGPDEENYKQYVSHYNIHNVKFLGYQTGNSLWSLVKNSMFTILPSEWYENAPYSIYESLALGKPVLGARIGGIPELIQEEETGSLFESGNTQDLISKINWFLENQDKIEQMGKVARNFMQNLADPKRYYQQLISIYQKLIKN